MALLAKIKHYTFSAITALSDSNSAETVATGIQAIVADWGVEKSVERQLVGILQVINTKLVDLGPYAARQVVGKMSTQELSRHSCSIYDAKPGSDLIERSGALVFVRYFTDTFGVVREPVVELVGFGRDAKSAWKQARSMPKISAAAVGEFQRDKSYMLWYYIKDGRIAYATIPYPFYLGVVDSK